MYTLRCNNCNISFKTINKKHYHERICQQTKFFTKNFERVDNIFNDINVYTNFDNNHDYNTDNYSKTDNTDNSIPVTPTNTNEFYLKSQQKALDTKILLSTKGGQCKSVKGNSYGEGNLYNYLEVVNYTESNSLSMTEGDELINLIKWISYENGKEIFLPSQYKYLRDKLDSLVNFR
jgi:hypothetical protein